MAATMDRMERRDYMARYRASEVGRLRLARGKAAWLSRRHEARGDLGSRDFWRAEADRLEATIREVLARGGGA